jgi:hypothetical protein
MPPTSRKNVNQYHISTIGTPMSKRRVLARWLKRLCRYENAPPMAGTATERGKLRRLSPSSRPSFNMR